MPVPALTGIDRTTLTPVVRAVLDSRSAEVVEWQAISVLQGRASPAGVFRVVGTAQDQEKMVPWSLVVKVHQSAELAAYGENKASNDPADMFYWKRELLLYQSGIFGKLPDGFAAPRCYQIDELPQEGRIWMEHVSEDIGTIWPLSHFGEAARHLGRFNGTFLTREGMPDWPWLMRDVSRRRIEGNDWPEFWSHYPTLRQENALVKRGWSDDLAHGVNQIWQEREVLCHALERLPQTLNHYDAGRKNLFARRQANGAFETLAVDWGSAGIGAVGEDLAVFVSQPVYWFNGVSPEQLQGLDEIAFDGYMQGLRDVGWEGNAALVRLGYTASLAMRCGFGIFIVEWVARDQALRSWIEAAMAHSIEEITDTLRGLRPFVVACGEEARRLLTAQEVKRYL